MKINWAMITEITLFVGVIFFSIVGVAVLIWSPETPDVQLPLHRNMAPIPIFDSMWDGIWLDEEGDTIVFYPRADGVYEGINENVQITFSVMEQHREYGLAMYCVEKECRADLIQLTDGAINDVSFNVLHLERFDE